MKRIFTKFGLEKYRIVMGALKKQALTVYFVSMHPSTPKRVKYLAMFVAGYAFSPIDLIPDFIPILGYLDDAVILPLGLYFIVRLTPDAVLIQCRRQAELSASKPISRLAGGMVVLVWLLGSIWLLRWIVN